MPEVGAIEKLASSGNMTLTLIAGIFLGIYLIEKGITFYNKIQTQKAEQRKPEEKRTRVKTDPFDIRNENGEKIKAPIKMILNKTESIARSCHRAEAALEAIGPLNQSISELVAELHQTNEINKDRLDRVISSIALMMEDSAIMRKTVMKDIEMRRKEKHGDA